MAREEMTEAKLLEKLKISRKIALEMADIFQKHDDIFSAVLATLATIKTFKATDPDMVVMAKLYEEMFMPSDNELYLKAKEEKDKFIARQKAKKENPESEYGKIL